MSVFIEITCRPHDGKAAEIRGILCNETKIVKDGRNPLIETKFNVILGEIAQAAFDEGRCFERSNPDLKE